MESEIDPKSVNRKHDGGKQRFKQNSVFRFINIITKNFICC